jgi:3-phosphoshikimate 1-carboxyvinyltransferase
LNCPLTDTDKITLPPLSKARGSITPQGSKSISNRVLPLAALGKGTSIIQNLPGGDDVYLMKNALRLLGTEMKDQGSELQITGLGHPFLCKDKLALHLGNSGTATRFLTALLCAGQGTFEIDGVPRLRERPIKDLIDALNGLAFSGDTKKAPHQDRTHVTYLMNPGYPPLLIHACGLQGGETKIKGNVSSQFLTGLLMTLPLCDGPTKVVLEGKLVSPSYVKLTLDIMKEFACEIEDNGFLEFRCPSSGGYQNPASYCIEADASSASYFLAAGAIAGEPVTVHGVGNRTLQYSGEGGFARLLEQMGAKVEIKPYSITVSRGNLKGIEANMNAMSDTGMTLAVLALFADGPTHITNVQNWRVKETDRLHAMAVELRKLGARVDEGRSDLTVYPPRTWQSAEIETYDDHRMAMSFSLAAFSGLPVTILNPQCVTKTFPGYFDEFTKITAAS